MDEHNGSLTRKERTEMNYVQRWKGRVDYHLSFNEDPAGPFVYYKDVEPRLKEIEILRAENQRLAAEREAFQLERNSWRTRASDLETRLDTAMVRIKALEAEPVKAPVGVVAERHGWVYGSSLSEWVEGKLKRLEELEKERSPSALHRDLLQLARDFGFQGEDGVGLWAWFRDRLQERTRFRARLDLLAEEMRKP